MKPSWYMDPLDSVFPPTNDDQSPLMSWADYGPREIHSAVASAVTLVSQSYMTYFSDAQPMSILWFVCVSFWGICLHFFFVLFILFTEGLLFVFFLSECMCTVFYFYVRVFVSYPVFSSYQPSLLKGRKEKRYSSLFSLKEKGKKKYRLSRLSSLHETTANLYPHLKNTHNAAIRASPPAPPAGVASSQGAPVLSGALRLPWLPCRDLGVQRQRIRRHTCLFSRCSHVLFFRAT